MKQLYTFIFVLLSFFGYSQMGERILSYDASVIVDNEADLIVTETIKVNALGRDIRRGIHRDFPTTRKDAKGKSVDVRYDIREVLQDGQPAKHFTREEGGFLKLYIGDADVFIPHGIHTYKITYSTYNQIGFFENHDELYWNVTGTRWDFPIDKVTATYTFPEGANIQGLECYTGNYGSNAQDCRYSLEPNLLFEAENLSPREGLTTVVAITPGIINKPPPPSFLERFGFLLMVIAGGLILGGYYLFTWVKHGIDPAKPAVYPIYDSPENLSPAAVGSIHKDKVSSEYISASIINLAVKGYLKITDESTKRIFGKSQAYRLEYIKPIGNDEPVEEKEFFNTLFAHSKSILVDGEYDSDIEDAVTMYRNALNSKYSSLIEEGRNYKFLILPILLMIGVLVVASLTHLIELPEIIGQIFSGGLFFTLFGLMFFLPMIIRLASRFTWAKWIFPIVLLALFLGLIVAVPNAEMNFYVFVGFAIFGIVSLIVYKYLIERPSEEKLRLQSLIEGFQMYMAAAENHQIQNFNPPNMTPEIFEKLLPYAIALKADKVWGKKFQNYLAAAAISNYSHTWYVGHGFDPNFYSVMNSTMRNTVNSSSVKPAPESQGGGSSWGSGMGGGGFSGGGGGGGGGGGW